MYIGSNLKKLLVAAAAWQLVYAVPLEGRHAKPICKKTKVVILGAGITGIIAAQSENLACY
jgi:hypothetical protein